MSQIDVKKIQNLQLACQKVAHFWPGGFRLKRHAALVIHVFFFLLISKITQICVQKLEPKISDC